MSIDFSLLPNISNKWECENCENSIDLEWLLMELIDECENNLEYYDYLLESTDSFEYGACSTCNHSIWFYDQEVLELQELVSSIINNKIKE